MTRPNVVMILSDDHAANAISAYSSRINQTPQLDRLATDGVRFDSCFCTNALCTPSRAAILTGEYSHRNGVYTLRTGLDNRRTTFVTQLHDVGYQTAVFGKWHLGHDVHNEPAGFDQWSILRGQGTYFDPVFIGPDGESTHQGYATDLITDQALSWLDGRDPERPFCLLVHHKAPHRKWLPDAAHADMFEDVDIPEPTTLRDDYSNRGPAAREARMRIADDLDASDLKADPPEGLSEDELLSWKYQRYIKDYLRCVASMDDNIGRLLDHLDASGLTEDTIVIYASDQGFFLGEHGWYDKRFMYEESLQMPLLVRWPAGTATAGTHTDAIVTNVDFAPTILELCGVPVPDSVQGRSFAAQVRNAAVPGDQESMYYRFYAQGGNHQVRAHYGVRTRTHKLICYPGTAPGVPGASEQTFDQEWELFDLVNDPDELHSRWDDPDHAGIQAELIAELNRLRTELEDVS